MKVGNGAGNEAKRERERERVEGTCSPNDSKKEAFKVIDVSSLWIKILHYIFEYVKSIYALLPRFPEA